MSRLARLLGASVLQRLPVLALLVSGSLALGGLTACGGGGGAGVPEPPPTIDLGQLSATTPTRVGRTFLNPLGATATVTAPDVEGPFAFDPDDLPSQVPAGGGVNLGILFTPEGPGEAISIIVLRFTAGGSVADRPFELKAVGEAIGWTVNPDPVDFGDVLPGESVELDIEIRNDSQRSPVTFSAAIPPSNAFVLSGVTLPLSIQPGQNRTLKLRFSPEIVAVHGGVLRLGPSDPGGPLDIRIWANASGAGEKIIDLGVQGLTNGETPELTVDVPADAVSVTFEGTMSDGDKVGLLSLTGPGGKVYENVSSTGPVLWMEWQRTFSIHIPSSDRSTTQLVAGGGIYRFRLYRFSGSSTTMGVRVILERRPTGGSTNAVLPLNIFLSKAVPATAATAATDPKLQSVLTQMAQLLQPQNISLGAISYYDVADTALDDIAQGEESTLFQKSSVAQKVRMNLFFVRSTWGGQVLGLAGAIDGAKRKGESVTGVMVQYENLGAGTVALVATHEMCHYLGLWHTAESTGAHDQIDDTVECPAFGTSASCGAVGGGLLMHWQLQGGQTITSGQGRVLRGHVHMHPAGQAGALQAKPLRPWVPDAQTLEELKHLPVGWCATRR